MTSLIEKEIEDNGLTFLTESPVFNSILQKAKEELKKKAYCERCASDIEEVLGR